MSGERKQIVIVFLLLIAMFSSNILVVAQFLSQSKMHSVALIERSDNLNIPWFPQLMDIARIGINR